MFAKGELATRNRQWAMGNCVKIHDLPFTN